MKDIDKDKYYMQIAINLAKRNKGYTAENPSVGCVIVKNDKIIAVGATANDGRPHAEIIAIDSVNDKSELEGSTLYVTLEPCCHFGKSLPCTNSIIQYKISKVVIANQDLDTRVNGNGIKILKEGGVEVITGVMEDESYIMNEDFFHYKKEGFPYIAAKLAMSLDGKIGSDNIKWLSNVRTLEYTNFLRSKFEAILVGSNTVIKDNPILNCRTKNNNSRNPIRIILNTKFNLTEEYNVFQTAKEQPTVLVIGKDYSNMAKRKIFEKLNVCVLEVGQSNNMIDIKEALLSVNNNYKSIKNVLLEGGSAIFTSFLEKNLINELLLVFSNKIIGNSGLQSAGDLPFALENFSLYNTQQIDNDLICFYKNDS